MEKTKPEKDADIIDWLNRLIMLAQWDAKFPFQIASLFTDSEKYKQALDQIQTALTKPGVPLIPISLRCLEKRNGKSFLARSPRLLL